MVLVLIWPPLLVVSVYNVLGDPDVQLEFVHGPLIDTDLLANAVLSMCFVSVAVNVALTPLGGWEPGMIVSAKAVPLSTTWEIVPVEALKFVGAPVPR